MAIPGSTNHAYNNANGSNVASGAWLMLSMVNVKHEHTSAATGIATSYILALNENN